MPRVTERRRLLRIDNGETTETVDTLVAEEPLEIRVGGEPLTVTMRTPGNDFELAAGLLFTEGVVASADNLRELRYCVGDEVQQYNVVDVTLAPGVAHPSTDRTFASTAACGVCGKTSIDDVRIRSAYDVATDPVQMAPGVLASLPARLRDGQRVFERTGGLHAAGLFDADGDLVCLREDVGRHNAFDKVIGWAVLERRIPLTSHVLVASGRAGFELVQKALMAGVPMVAAVSAPSSLAVDLADEAGMTLVGFLRGETMNVYTGAGRVV